MSRVEKLKRYIKHQYETKFPKHFKPTIRDLQRRQQRVQTIIQTRTPRGRQILKNIINQQTKRFKKTVRGR